jgi:hypothetical protein
VTFSLYGRVEPCIPNCGCKIWRDNTSGYVDIDVRTTLIWIFEARQRDDIRYINYSEDIGQCLAVMDNFIDHYIRVSVKTRPLVLSLKSC